MLPLAEQIVAMGGQRSAKQRSDDQADEQSTVRYINGSLKTKEGTDLKI